MMYLLTNLAFFNIGLVKWYIPDEDLIFDKQIMQRQFLRQKIHKKTLNLRHLLMRKIGRNWFEMFWDTLYIGFFLNKLRRQQKNPLLRVATVATKINSGVMYFHFHVEYKVRLFVCSRIQRNARTLTNFQLARSSSLSW